MTRDDWQLIREALTDKMMSSNSEMETAHCGMVLMEISEKLRGFKCQVCGKPYDDIDVLTEGSRLHGMCVGCFTNNA